MKILLTGSSSGLGKELKTILGIGHEVDAPSRQKLNLADHQSILNYMYQCYDILINCAGTGIGGKIDFVQHDPADIQTILQTNLLGTVLLTHQVLKINTKCKIVNITSTNNNRYWPNDLAYSLSKKSLEIFGHMLTVEYPSLSYLEIKIGLTKTNFNANRYRRNPGRFTDIYESNSHLLPNDTAQKIVEILFDNRIKSIEISP